MDNVLPLLSCYTLKKFSLNFVFKYDDGVSYFPVIDEWLEFAANKKVVDLHLNIRIFEDCVLNWTSMKSLMLEDLFLRDEHIKKIMSNYPQLESLRLHEFCGFNHLHMTSPKCSDTRIKLRDFSSLNHANLDLHCDEFDEMVEKIVKDLLVSTRCVNELILSSWFIKVSDFHFDVGRGRCLLTIAGMQMVDNKFLYFKIFVPPTRQPLKLENLMIFPDRTCYPYYEDEEIDLSEDKKYLSIEEHIQSFLTQYEQCQVNIEKLVIVPNHNDCNSCSTNIFKSDEVFVTFSNKCIYFLRTSGGLRKKKENDMFDGEDDEDMLDKYFDKLAKEEDLSSRQQRSGSNKKNKKRETWKGA
ncbi:hypothetical protein H5410_005074 [Solanum commersonii]|uniref:Uncharacterized protein n=1 Tax=Solanum commersonii TaxID=4109 RepID=A0A9J6A653_SOLCO|nr:hypothetical protein H5410_005074 [Solanum commersonii]